MKVKVFALLAALSGSALNVSGQEIASNQMPSNVLDHGYRAFIEVEGMTPSSLNDICVLGITTTHGYQFNPHFFAGMGIGAIALIGGTGLYDFLDFRYDASESNRGLYFGLKTIGIFDFEELVIQPRIGYRLNHMNLSAGCWLGDGDTLFTIGLGWDFGGRKKRK